MEEKELKIFKKLIERAGRVVYSKTNYVSQSGMNRAISFYVCIPLTKKEQEREEYRGSKPKTKIINIDWQIKEILDYKLHRTQDGLAVGGCGMDMHFSVVYNLGSALFPNGDGITITGRNGDKKPETDGGYLLENKKL